jgi:N-acyl-D-aspartate/D-glutamate deacylase
MRLRASRILDDLPGWRDVIALGPDERRRAVTDPATREKLRAGAEEAARRGLGAIAQPELLEIADAPAGSESLIGRSIADIAAERGADPVDVLIDVVLPDRLPLTMVFPSLVPSLGRSDEGWRVRAGVWRDDRTVLGGSDAGAHADLMCHANYTTMLLGESVRDRALLTLEEAVRQLTDVPARLYGLRDRGRVAEGWIADLVVFDPARIGSGPTQVRHDLPGGGERLYAEAQGVEHVLVNGREIVAGGRLTGDLAGTLLRSGRDTDTVTVPGVTT